MEALPGKSEGGQGFSSSGVSHAAFAFDAALSRPLPMATPGCGRDHHLQCPPDMVRMMMVATPSELAKGTTTLPRTGLTPPRLAAGVGNWLADRLPRSMEPESASRRFARQSMDEKTLNLWRQIESCRRRSSRQAARPTAAPSPERQGAKD